MYLGLSTEFSQSDTLLVFVYFLDLTFFTLILMIFLDGRFIVSCYGTKV